jgi:sensor histidine kinase regulating citrate/malate metabolism
MTIIHMENNFDKIIQRNDKYLSMKKEHSPGIGLKRMEDIVTGVEGILQINSENHVFMVHIMIPQKEDTNETNDINS